MLYARFRLLLVAAVTACAVGVGTADAGIVSSPGQLEYTFDKTFSGDLPPFGAPYLKALFQDLGDPDQVKLTLTAGTLNVTSFISELYFNILGNATTGLGVVLNSSTGNGVTLAGTDIGPDVKKADGDGWYDVKLSFGNSGNGRFEATESAVLTFTRAGGLRVTDFFDTSVAVPPVTNYSQAYYAAAHLQGTPDSHWIRPATDGEFTDDDTEVPEPASLVLAALGSLGAIVAGRRRQAQRV